MLAESLLNAPAVLPLDLHCVENALLPFKERTIRPLRGQGLGVRGWGFVSPSPSPLALSGAGQWSTPRIHNFGTMLEPRYIVGAERLDQ